VETGNAGRVVLAGLSPAGLRVQEVRDLAMQSTDVVCSFNHVQKTYDGETLVVKNLNLNIARGEFLTLLGPSGSGKTTTLMMLAGFEVPTQGEILLEGQSIARVPPHQRNIGMVFQNYALFPHMTVEENLAFPLKVRGMDRAARQARIGRTLDMVKLADKRHRYPSQLSGGQQQRVALARALVFGPKLVLMDEPLGALDKQLREHMQLEIKHIHQSLGVTVVYVTHDQAEALTLSDRVAVFHDGIIQQIDAPTALYEQPGSRFVANFIGENNLLHGVVDQLEGPRCRVRMADGGSVQAAPVRVSGVGARTCLSIRPERVVVNPEPGTYANRFEAQVAELIYHGDHVRVGLHLLGSTEFKVKVPAGSQRVLPRVGERITVAWHPQDCRALDPE
jgi:putative spermidine/putrescine transport system ATP-binding protein